MVYQYREGKPQRWSLEDIAPQTYKGLSGKQAPGEPPMDSASESLPKTQNLPMSPPPVAVTGSKGAPEAISPQTFGLNPFGQGKVIVFFPLNSNELTPEAREALDQIAAFLKSEGNVKVLIKGYTDAVGSTTYNISVSQFRANSIKSYLVGKGVNPDDLVAMGLGPKNPMASNDTQEGRQQNRRVEIEPDRK
jgi:OOP family OmpA-OmpF porin